jgi:hypothetical protein
MRCVLLDPILLELASERRIRIDARDMVSLK